MAYPSSCPACSTLLTDPENMTRLVSCPPVINGRTSGLIQEYLTTSRAMEELTLSYQNGCPLCKILVSDVLGIAYIPPIPGALMAESIQEDLLPHTRINLLLEACGVHAHDDFDEIKVWWKIGNVAALEQDAWHLARRLLASCYSSTSSVTFNRPAARSFSSLAAVQSILQEIDECVNSHARCPKPLLEFCPDRLIAVSEPIRLVTSLQEKAPYAALSYCWGFKEQPVMLTKNKSAEFQLGLPKESLPQTVLDAIAATKAIGVPYIWADSLCIIQDDESDKNKQIEDIPRIFSDTYVTISASNSSSCTTGFLKPSAEVELEDFQLPYCCVSGESGRLVLQPMPMNVHTGLEPIYERAWTLEERLLSPRVLIYGTETIFWQCQTATKVVGRREFFLKNDDQSNWVPFVQRLDNDFFSQSLSGSLPRSVAQLRRQWFAIMEDYSARRVSSGKDRLRAISGLAARFQPLWPLYSYHAGLWHGQTSEGETFFLQQLLWREMLSTQTVREKYPVDELAPSWSWASTGGSVDWLDIGHAHLDDDEPADSKPGRVLSCRSQLTSSLNPFGQVQQAEVTLKGPYHTMDLYTKRGLHIVIEMSEEASPYIHLHSAYINRAPEHLRDVGLLLLLKNCGLLVIRADNDRYVRIGMFKFVHVEDEGVSGEKALQVAVEHFHSCLKKKITIV